MRRWLWLAAGLSALALQGALRPALQARQRDEGLVITPADGAGLSAEVALPTLALGAFRGLFVDYLWLRSISLREQGRHYEARQLAEQICRLQPRLPEVWSYLAHDLAYNLAAIETDAEPRWRWIQNGIALLRDQGLRHNPDAPELYWSLSRIYQDKLLTSLDDHHGHYKREHALDMLAVMGDAELREVAAAPSVEALLAQDEAARRLEEEARWLLSEGLRTALPKIERSLVQGLVPPPEVREDLERLRAAPAYARLRLALARDHLERALRVDPARALEVDRAWGPLDWRAPHAMAVYWAAEGARVAEAQGDLKETLRLRRGAMQALKNALRGGRVSVLGGRIIYVPMIELTERIDRLYVESIRLARERLDRPADAADHAHTQAADAHEEGEEGAAESYWINQMGAREDFLGEAIVLLAEYGREQEARRLFARARQAYPTNALFMTTDFDDFLVRVFGQRFADAGVFDTRPGMTQLVEGTWTKAFRALALGEDERYRGLARLARASQDRWERFLDRLRPTEPQVDARMGIPWREVRLRALERALSELPPEIAGRLFERIPEARDLLQRRAAPPPQEGPR